MTVKRNLRSYPDALTVADVAEILQVSTKTVYNKIKTGKLFSVRLGRENRISKSSLMNYMQTAEKKPLRLGKE